MIVGQGGHFQIVIMQWGLTPHWAKDARIGYKLINTREVNTPKHNSRELIYELSSQG